MATFCIGGFIGANFAGGLANFLGRKRLIVCLNAPFLLAGGLAFFAGWAKGNTGLYALITSRILQGLGSGCASVATPMYLGEIATSETKGAFGALNQFVLVIFILIVQLLGLVMSTTALWGPLLALTGVLAILGVLSSPFFVESPRWLHSQGRVDEAKKSLVALRHCSEDEADNEVAEWDAEIQNGGSNKQMGMSDVLKRTDLRFPLLIACIISLTQQLSGINA